MELTHLQFLTRYTSCNIHSLAEINEEARVNSLIKNISEMKKNLKEDQCRVVMELEREEERMINKLVGRLEEVTREKQFLEQQLGRVSSTHIAGGTSPVGRGGAKTGADEQRLQAQFEQMMAHHQQQEQEQHNNIPSETMSASTPARKQKSTSAPVRAAAVTSTMIGSELSLQKEDENNGTMMEEDEEDEEEDVENEDILGGRCHDPKMEEELANLLKMKDR